jgi:hypothetical protein
MPSTEQSFQTLPAITATLIDITPLPATPISTIIPPTVPPTDIPQPDQITSLRHELASIFKTPQWEEIGLSSERASSWKQFVTEDTDLAADELNLVISFVNQWQTLFPLLSSPIPPQSKPTLKISETVAENGAIHLALYVQHTDNPVPSQLFLIGFDRDSQAIALVQAPIISGLTQRSSSDGQFVEYLDEKGSVILFANARKLDKSRQIEKTLFEMLKENDAEFYYNQASVYPRFYFTEPDIESGFFLVEQLTVSQIQLLIETFREFNRPNFGALKENIFPPGDDVPFLVSRQPHPFAAALALSLGGTPRQGIVVLISRNIFHSKYQTVGGLAHEAAHIWQGRSPGCDDPQARLRREIGDGTIPQDFHLWTSDQLVSAAKQFKIGAYHLSLWVAIQYRLRDEERFYRSIILTGTANGQPIINCGNN